MRSIRHGRAPARRILYLCGTVATRCNPVLTAHHRHLLAKGKAVQVARVAVARKLLQYLNAVLQEKAA